MFSGGGVWAFLFFPPPPLGSEARPPEVNDMEEILVPYKPSKQEIKDVYHEISIQNFVMNTGTMKTKRVSCWLISTRNQMTLRRGRAKKRARKSEASELNQRKNYDLNLIRMVKMMAAQIMRQKMTNLDSKTL